MFLSTSIEQGQETIYPSLSRWLVDLAGLIGEDIPDDHQNDHKQHRSAQHHRPELPMQEVS
jgi:hypothetical protein